MSEYYEIEGYSKTTTNDDEFIKPQYHQIGPGGRRAQWNEELYPATPWEDEETTEEDEEDKDNESESTLDIVNKQIESLQISSTQHNSPQLQDNSLKMPQQNPAHFEYFQLSLQKQSPIDRNGYNNNPSYFESSQISLQKQSLITSQIFNNNSDQSLHESQDIRHKSSNISNQSFSLYHNQQHHGKIMAKSQKHDEDTTNVILSFEKIFIERMNAKSKLFANFNWFECHNYNQYCSNCVGMRTMIKAAYLIYSKNGEEPIVKKTQIPPQLVLVDVEMTKIEEKWKFIKNNFDNNNHKYSSTIGFEFCKLQSIYNDVNRKIQKLEYKTLSSLFCYKMNNWLKFIYKCQQNHSLQKEEIIKMFEHVYIENDLWHINKKGLFCELV